MAPRNLSEVYDSQTALTTRQIRWFLKQLRRDFPLDKPLRTRRDPKMEPGLLAEVNESRDGKWFVMRFPKGGRVTADLILHEYAHLMPSAWDEEAAHGRCWGSWYAKLHRWFTGTDEFAPPRSPGDL